MTVTVELPTEVEQLARIQAEARGVAFEDYLPLLLAEAVQQEDWDDDDASRRQL